MKNNKIEEIVLEYLSGNFDDTRKKELEDLLIQNDYDFNDIDELKKMYHRLDDISVPEPSEKMTDNFYQMLESKKNRIRKQENWLENLFLFWKDFTQQKYALRVAYSFLLLFT